jgi:hypothetical protein
MCNVLIYILVWGGGVEQQLHRALCVKKAVLRRSTLPNLVVCTKRGGVGFFGKVFTVMHRAVILAEILLVTVLGELMSIELGRGGRGAVDTLLLLSGTAADVVFHLRR